MYSRMIFASFHQGKEEIKFAFSFSIPCHLVVGKPGHSPQTHSIESALPPSPISHLPAIAVIIVYRYIFLLIKITLS